MPGFISHIVMAKDVYDKLKNKNVNLEYMLTYSLGGDLCKYAKCRYDSHHKNMDKFIYNMALYMKDNKLDYDSECLGVLYGHIGHYVMDSKLHPLVWKITKKCVSNQKNHTWIEQYYNEYLVNKVFNLELGDYVKGKILGGRINKKIGRMIDYAYEKTYHTLHVSRYYRFNLFLYRIERIVMMINAKLWYKLNGFDRFIKVNKDIDLLNDKDKFNLMELYNNSLEDTIKYIREINKYMKEK